MLRDAAGGAPSSTGGARADGRSCASALSSSDVATPTEGRTPIETPTIPTTPTDADGACGAGPGPGPGPGPGCSTVRSAMAEMQRIGKLYGMPTDLGIRMRRVNSSAVGICYGVPASVDGGGMARRLAVNLPWARIRMDRDPADGGARLRATVPERPADAHAAAARARRRSSPLPRSTFGALVLLRSTRLLLSAAATVLVPLLVVAFALCAAVQLVPDSALAAAATAATTATPPSGPAQWMREEAARGG